MDDMDGLLYDKRASVDSQEYSQMKPMIQESDKSKGKKSKKTNWDKGAQQDESGVVEPIPFD